MGIEAKRRGWKFGNINVDVYKKMTSKVPRRVKTLYLEIFMPSELASQKYRILRKAAEKCPVKLNLESSIDIKLNWHQKNN